MPKPSTRNPYIYTGALDPVKDKMVLIPRSEHLNRVVKGIRNGSYWAILGPRSLGKTTFLRQIANRLRNTYYLYFNFEISPGSVDAFYEWLMAEITDKIPAEPVQIHNNKSSDPRHRFLTFLENFKPREDKKIVLLFDEVEGISFAPDFLKIWRKIHTERFQKKELKKYAVVIAGSGNLLALTTKPGSPFNIAEKLYMRDFSREESERLIDKPLEKLNIAIDPNAKKKLIDQLSGHPQMLQHICCNLVDKARNENRGIRENDVDGEIETLLETNTTLDTLRADWKGNKKLQDLVRDIFKGAKKKYFLYNEFSITGAGSIVENGSFCNIRNSVYETFLKAMVDSLESDSSRISEETRQQQITTIKSGDLVVDNSSKKYKIIETIGKGGIGVLYKAEDLSLGRTVALKMLNTSVIEDEQILQKFCAEARNTASLDHPNIVKIFHIGRVKNQHFISMEFIEGENLLNKINAYQEFTYVHALYIAKELLKALHCSHTRTIIHGDIKPQNIMITTNGEVKIVDFGMSVIRNRDVRDEVAPLIGSIYYIAPEQINGEELDPRTDIYSMGVTLFHLIARTVPFTGNNILSQHLWDPVPIQKFGRDVPDEIIKVIEKCMAKDREHRFQTAQEIIDRIEKIELQLLGRNTTKQDIYDITPIMGVSNMDTILVPEQIAKEEDYS